MSGPAVSFLWIYLGESALHKYAHCLSGKKNQTGNNINIHQPQNKQIVVYHYIACEIIKEPTYISWLNPENTVEWRKKKKPVFALSHWLIYWK